MSDATQVLKKGLDFVGWLVSFAAVCVFLAFMLTMAIVTMAPVAAHAEPPADENRLYLTSMGVTVNPSEKLVVSLQAGLEKQDGGVPEAGTDIHVATFSCGAFLQESSVTYNGTWEGATRTNFSPDGEFSLTPNTVNRRVGPSIEYQIDIVQPGYDAYHIEGSFSNYGTVNGKPLKRPSCDEIANGGNGGAKKCVVKAKAKKWGQVRVGRNVRAVRPKLTGPCGGTTYTWKANGKVIRKNGNNLLHIGPKLRHKRLVAVVKVAKVAKPQVLVFGRVR